MLGLPRWFHRWASPPYVYTQAERLRPWAAWLAALLIVAGAYSGLVLAPPDYLQGDSARIMYVHVPSAYLGMLGYVVMAVASAIGFVWRIKLAHAVAVSVAPIGASFTFLALVTGGIWGRPTWGTFWEWGDARIMFELLLLFLYLGYLVLRAAFEDREKADRVSSILAVVGVVNVPIIHYSVVWWSTLHQGSTLATGSITLNMVIPLLIMLAGFTLCFLWLALNRLQGQIVERERDSRWLRQLVAEGQQ
jgi:heme exporter protein C